MVTYTGNGAYCYANSTAMALRALGHAVDPGYIECVTAFAMGAQLIQTPDGPLPFFDAPSSSPELGVSLALQTLGYTFEHHSVQQESDPEGAEALRQMAAWLAQGPVIVGPLDMGFLLYNPNHHYLGGADHYVLVYGLTETEVLLHDPAGFPYVSMTREAFVKAWQAESIDYRQGAYGMWGCLRRTATPSAEEIFAATDRQVAAQYRWKQGRPGAERLGAGTFEVLAQLAAEGPPPYLRGHLLHFALPVSARRCEDFADFYAQHDPERAQIKREQARCYGRAHSVLMRGDLPAFVAVLHQLAELEAAFEMQTLAVQA